MLLTSHVVESGGRGKVTLNPRSRFRRRRPGTEAGAPIDMAFIIASVSLKLPTRRFTNGVVCQHLDAGGSSVKSPSSALEAEDFTVIATDADYFAKPVSVGDAVSIKLQRKRMSCLAAWLPDDKHQQEGTE